MNIPGELVSDLEALRDRLVDATGRWSRHRIDDRTISLSFQSVDRPGDLPLPYGNVLFTEMTSRGPRLYSFRGDPDERVIIAFDKAAPL